jgi:hypothetical protein
MYIFRMARCTGGKIVKTPWGSEDLPSDVLNFCDIFEFTSKKGNYLYLTNEDDASEGRMQHFHIIYVLTVEEI